MIEQCEECGLEIPEGMDTKDSGTGDGSVICYPCHVGGITFGKVPYGTGVTDSVRSEVDLHKRLADEAGHEWQPL